MKFKKRRGIKLSYTKQGLIHFTCMDYKDQPQEIKNKIVDLCVAVAGEDYQALFDIMTNEHESITSISLKYFIAETKLYELRNEFYKNWDKK